MQQQIHSTHNDVWFEQMTLMNQFFLMSQLKRFTKQPWVSNLNQIHNWLPHWTESVFSPNEMETVTLQKMLFLLRFFVLFPAKISKNKSHLSEFLLRTSRIICQWDKENNLISNRKQDYLFYPFGRLFCLFFSENKTIILIFLNNPSF